MKAHIHYPQEVGVWADPRFVNWSQIFGVAFTTNYINNFCNVFTYRKTVLNNFNKMARHRINSEQCVITWTKYFHIGGLVDTVP